MSQLKFGNRGLLIALALAAVAGGRWIGVIVFGGSSLARVLGSDAAIGAAIQRMGQFAHLCSLIQEIEALEASSGAAVEGDSGAGSLPRSGDIGSLARYLHARRSQVSIDDILLTPSLSESSEPVNEELRRQVRSLLEVFRWRCLKLLGYRASIIQRQGSDSVLQGRLKEAQFRHGPEVEAFVSDYAKNHPGQAILHLNPELYDGGDDIADWLTIDGKLYLLTYELFPELEVIDNYMIYLEKRCACEIAEMLCSAGRIRATTRDRILGETASLRFNPK